MAINEETIIFNTKPAEFGHCDASIVGGGGVWSSIKGAYSNEEIVLWRRELKGGGYTGVLQDVSDKFPSVRKIYHDGKILDAERLLPNEFKKRGYHPKVENPIPVAGLGLDFVFGGFVTNYSRVTDMQNGEVEVSFDHGGATQTRRCFAAAQSGIFSYDVHDTGRFDLNIAVQNEKANISYEGEYIFCAARTEGGLDYGFVARIVATCDGVKRGALGGSRISIKNIDSLLVQIKTFNDSNRDTEFKKIKAELATLKPYDKMIGSHSAAHRKMFDSYALTLGGGGDEDRDFGAFLSGVVESEVDPGLVSRLWNLGKYLNICGISVYDISLFNAAQLIYCGSTSDVLQDIVVEFFQGYEKYLPDLKKNAARIFGMQGYFIPSVISPKSALVGAVDAGTIHFISAGALAANIFYRHYLATGDQKMLKSRIFPVMREVLNFYSDFLKLDHNGFYTTIPSYSPMSTPGNVIAGRPLENFGFAVNSAIDFLALGALIDNLIECAPICGATEDVPMWQDMKTKMPPFAVTTDGELREYLNCAFINGAVNCGTMHAYGLWPLKTISFNDRQVTYQPTVAVGSAAREQQIGLRQASFNAVISRLEQGGQKQDARSILVAAMQIAHAGLGKVSSDHARETILKVLSSCITPSGLCMAADFRGSGFTKNRPAEFDVAGNIGFTNAITECIIQSNQSTLRVLPCMFDAISVGKITDVVTDFCAKVSIEWDIKKGKCVVKILPKVSRKINIEISKPFKKVKNKEIDINNLDLVAGRAVTLDFV